MFQTSGGIMGFYFYPRPPRGGRPVGCHLVTITIKFLSTPSARRATNRLPTWTTPQAHFYPRPPRGGRRARGYEQMAEKIFLSTPSARRATTSLWRWPTSCHFYPRPPRGGRPVADDEENLAGLFLSTPSARRATCFRDALSEKSDISIHALREEGDPLNRNQMGAMLDFYPRPPRGGRLARWVLICGCSKISIHALREEGDSPGTAMILPCTRFLSTPSARRATFHCWAKIVLNHVISIHALREEGDIITTVFCSAERLFLSTPSARRATKNPQFGFVVHDISIHALREEGDSGRRRWLSMPYNFYPRPPRGGRPVPSSETTSVEDFYPRPPRGGRHQEEARRLHGKDFYPRPPRGGRRVAREWIPAPPDISIHALREEGDRAEKRR